MEVLSNMRINLLIDPDWNDQRKKLNATWRTVIKAGLTALQGKPVESTKGLPPAIETHLQQAVKSLSGAWNLIKPFMKK
jgi:hypothetical protein